MSPAATRGLAAMLEARTGQQLSDGRRWRFEMALKPLMQARGLVTLDEIATLATGGSDPALANAVVDALLNNETSFFRDAGAFAVLSEAALPALAEQVPEGMPITLWCAGCSTGQEVYSVAMAVAGSVALRHRRVDILGTDVSQAAILRAREGRYPQIEIQRGLPIRMMLQWFREVGDGSWQATPELRARVRFQVRNLLDTPPAPGRFDMVLCRNVLLYLDDVRRATAFARLADALQPGGRLMLGAGETVIGQTERFAPGAEARGIYRLVD